MNVRLVDGRVQVLLDAEHASTRMLLDRNLPELRETLARAGVSIDDVRLTTNDDAPRSRAATPGAAMQPDTSDATPSRDDGASADDRRSRSGSHETIRTTSRFSLDAATGNDATHPDEPTTPDPSPPNGAGIGTRLNLVV